MNDDIVDRLGRLQDHLHGLDADVCADAASEIERLRGLIAAWAEQATTGFVEIRGRRDYWQAHCALVDEVTS